MKFNKKFIIVCLVVSFVIAVVLLASYLISVGNYQKAVRNISFNNINIKDISDGIYKGDCDVGFIYAKVSVNIKDGEIINIILLEHKNEKGNLAEFIIEDILQKQIIDVDTISGATNSSKVIKKAIENALIVSD